MSSLPEVSLTHLGQSQAWKELTVRNFSQNTSTTLTLTRAQFDKLAQLVLYSITEDGHLVRDN